MSVSNSEALSLFLSGYTAEVTSNDKKSIAAAKDMMQAGSEIFVASLPKSTLDDLVTAAIQIKEAGMIAVPHIVARNIKSADALNELLGRLSKEAGVDRALILGGDRDEPIGDFDASLQLIETEILQKNGFTKIYLACYPEGHARIPEATLNKARAEKIAAAEAVGLNVELISQFCFEAEPIIEFTKQMRRSGVKAPFRVGIAGPATRTMLIKYAIICGVGASLRALKERQNMAKNMFSSETPEKLLTALAVANAEDPELGLSGAHFFTFGSLKRSAEFIRPLLK